MANDIDQMRGETGNIQDKLSSLMMAQQEETQHQGSPYSSYEFKGDSSLLFTLGVVYT